MRGGDGSLPASGSLVEIEPATLVLSALKPAEDGDGVIVRVYNIADEPVKGRVRLNAAFGKVERVNLNEEEAEALDAREGGVELSLRPNEIVTLRFTRPSGAWLVAGTGDAA